MPSNRDYSTIAARLSLYDLIHIRRMMVHGIRCCEENHDNYRSRMNTYDVRIVLRKIERLCAEARAAKKAILAAKAKSVAVARVGRSLLIRPGAPIPDLLREGTDERAAE